MESDNRTVTAGPLSLAQFLKTSDYNGFLKHRGKGVRTFIVANDYEGVVEDDVLRKILQKEYTGESKPHAFLNEFIVQNVYDGVKRLITANRLTSENSDLDHVVPEFIESEKRTRPMINVQAEDKHNSETKVCCNCAKQRKTGDLHLSDKSTQTETVVSSQDQDKAAPREYREACVGTYDDINDTSADREKNLAVQLVSPSVNYNPCSVVGHSSSNGPPEQNNSVLKYNSPSDLQGGNYLNDYEKAKLWQPKNDDEEKALEQAKSDLYQLLVVGKGCKFRSIFSEFKRVVQEDLNLEKIGIPDLRTLLVQMNMKDLVYLKKARFSTCIYVYPKISHANFENVAHIAEFVAEQRDNLNVIPDPNSSILFDCDMRELFPPPTPQLQNIEATYYGSCSNRNQNIWNFGNYYPNSNITQLQYGGLRTNPYPAYANTSQQYQNFNYQQWVHAYNNELQRQFQHYNMIQYHPNTHTLQNRR